MKRLISSAGLAGCVGLLLLAACTPPVKVRAIASGLDRRDEAVRLEGSAIGYIGRTGSIDVASRDGSLVCDGSFAYTSSGGGNGKLFCNNAEAASIEFVKITSLSGYGHGITNEGRAIGFTYGLSQAESDRYLSTTPVAQKIGLRADGSVRRPGGLGSGFFVGAAGHVVTNDHVAFGCDDLFVIDTNDLRRRASLIDVQEEPDLALLLVDGPGPGALAVRRDRVDLAEEVMIFGYPLSTGTLSARGTLTQGSVASMAGVGDDPNYYGLNALSLPGNSGGPAVSADGALVGVVTGGVFEDDGTGDTIDGLAFAVKADRVAAFLDRNRVAYASASFGARMPQVERAKYLSKATVKVLCNPDD
ncbi:MAG: S1C family serine protease [Pseudomonadota bacterium]